MSKAKILIPVVLVIILAGGFFLYKKMLPTANIQQQPTVNSGAGQKTVVTAVDKIPETNPFKVDVNPYKYYVNPFAQQK